jgi:G3E family GTPase
VDIDGALLADDTGNVVKVPGGSIFCRCLVTEFVQAMTRIPAMADQVGGDVEGVIIEASGVANPMVVERMLSETGLDRGYALAHIVTVVDPATLEPLMHSLPNIRAQVEASDVALVNKTDLHDEAAIARCEELLRSIRPDIRIERTVYGKADIDLFSPRAFRNLEGEMALCRDPNYARFHIDLPEPIALETLERAASDLGSRLYRLKGFARIDGELQYVDWAGGRLTHQPARSPGARPQLVFIVAGDAEKDGERLVAALKGTPAPGPGIRLDTASSSR